MNISNHQSRLYTALLFGLFILFFGYPVPESFTEYLYIPALFKQYNPSFIAGDWTLSSPGYEHYVFNNIFGLLGLFFSMEAVAWIGRLSSWLLFAILMLRVGQHFKLPHWMSFSAVVFWIIQEQSLVSSSWMIRGFEAKSIAYLALLTALLGFSRGRLLLGSVFLGLSFSFHAAIGLSAGLACGFALLWQRPNFKQIVTMSALVILFALPGFIPIYWLLSTGQLDPAGIWEFIVLTHSPQHFDVLSWIKRDILYLYLLFLFNAIHAYHFRKNREIWFFFQFQLMLCGLFTLGIILRLTGSYESLKFFPFRLFPIFTLFFFFLHFFHAYLHRKESTHWKRLAFLGMLCLMGVGNPFGLFLDGVSSISYEWKKPNDDLRLSFKWVQKNTPEKSTLILPPWRDDSFQITRRAQIVNWWAIRYDALGEWKQRIEALVGKVTPSPTEQKLKKMEEHYNRLSRKQIQAIIHKYGGDYLVSKKQYKYQIMFKTKSYRVYALKKH